MRCQTKGCSREAAKNKVYCTKHLHGQRLQNPVSANEARYGKGRNKKPKNNK